MPGKSRFEGIQWGSGSEEQVVIDALFPTKSKYEMLQMITEQQPSAIMPWNVLGVLRIKYRSKVLEALQRQHNLNKIAQDRKGRLELSEVVSRARSMREKEED